MSRFEEEIVVGKVMEMEIKMADTEYVRTSHVEYIKTLGALNEP